MGFSTLSNFAIVKKHTFPIPRCIFFVINLLNAGFLSFVNADSFASVPDKKNTYYYSSLGNLHTEIEICSFQTPGATQGNYGFKKIPGHFTWDIKRLNYCAFFISLYSSMGNTSLKQYLSHIYPTHNFW